MSNHHLFTSESVTEGHPDKIADQVSDAILDACLAKDPRSRVACETLVTTGLALIAGEITTDAYVDMPMIVRNTIEQIGYTDSGMGFDFRTCAVLTSIDEQSSDISQGVTAGEGLHKAQGAGDQGLMFGFAVRETEELMPLPITLAHRLTQRLALVRKEGGVGYLRPDGKSQVTVRYDGHNPVHIDTVVLSTQHDEDVDHVQLEADMIEHVIRPILPSALVDESKINYLVNPTGLFVEGGPKADCGLTGRKIIVDTYGGMGRHGGGALSGKDPSKVDRSACYAARHVAKNLVAANLADRCEVQLAYAIGVAEPVSVCVDTFGTGKLDDARLTRVVRDVFDLTPAGIIGGLDLLKPIFHRTASYGHFGRPEENFPWEETAETCERVQAAASVLVS